MKQSTKAICELIKISGKSQRQIAIKFGIPPQHIHRWKSGSVIPSLQTFIELCECLDIKASDVFKNLT